MSTLWKGKIPFPNLPSQQNHYTAKLIALPRTMIIKQQKQAVSSPNYYPASRQSLPIKTIPLLQTVIMTVKLNPQNYRLLAVPFFLNIIYVYNFFQVQHEHGIPFSITHSTSPWWTRINWILTLWDNKGTARTLQNNIANWTNNSCYGTCGRGPHI